MSSPRFEVSFEDLVWLRYDGNWGLNGDGLAGFEVFFLFASSVGPMFVMGKVTFLFFPYIWSWVFCYCGIQGLNLASSPEFVATVI